jgi:hypothetical protein
LDKSKKKTIKVIKKLLVDGHGIGSIEEKLFDGGLLKNYLVSGKNINQSYLKIWKSMVQLKSKLSSKVAERKETDILLTSYDEEKESYY